MKTTKGTELPLLNLKGKDYLQVAHRVLWFREDHPDWPIETEAIEKTQQSCVFKAVIKTKEGMVLATAHKHEDRQHFPDFIEKAETGAIGRALALCGYGTQFATELDEETRIVDAPVAPRPSQPTQTTKQDQWNITGKAPLGWTQEPATEAQLKRLAVVASQIGLTDTELMDHIVQKYKIRSLKELTKGTIQDLFKEFEGK